VRLPAPLLALALSLAPAALAAQAVITSAEPDKTAVTIYRDPHRGVDDFIELDERLKGFALITETRTVDLPPGEVTVRFEGVASGIQPQSAILVGTDPAERNQDRLLLSEGGLVDAFTGQRVILRRTNRATGKSTEESVRIRSGHEGMVVETANGFEAVQCSGLPEAPVYPNVPAGLSAKPVLSVKTRAQAGGRRQLILSYLAADFDWQANYVATLSPDMKSLDLSAWLTLASRDDTSFPAADSAVVAGRVNREEATDDENDDDDDDDEDEGFWYYCWPAGTTGSPPAAGSSFAPGALPDLQAPMAIRFDDDYGYGGFGDGADIVVTGSRISRPEPLGDLKLYRIPFPVTVASRSLKQAAFLSNARIKGELVYRTRNGDWGEDPEWLFRFRNDKASGLGQPLPRGQVALFQKANGRPMLLGESKIDDRARDEEVEIVFEEATNVSVESDWIRDGKGWEEEKLTVANANPFAILYEAEFEDDDDQRFERFSKRMIRRKGKSVWRVRIPAESSASLTYREVEVEEAEDPEAEALEEALEEAEDGEY
jgi:hypothetical protein